MKVLFVDIVTDGHHKAYMKELIGIKNIEPILVVPERIDEFKCKQYVFKKVDFYNKKITEFIGWIREIKKIVKKENPDIVHFLYGDVFYKFFGFGLRSFSKYKTIVTIHSVRQRKIEMLSLKMILNRVKYGVFHTNFQINNLLSKGIKNIYHVEYPNFNSNESISKDISKQFFGIENNDPVLLCIGNTRFDKGLDILLNALKLVKKPFNLLIAGKEEAFNREYIQKNIEEYSERVTLLLNYLTDQEFNYALNASDIIVLPYRRIFNGASGPLGEGVSLRKTIIGPSHGSLGNIITENHIGYTFISEDIYDLAKIIDIALDNNFMYDEFAEKYKDRLNVESFIKSYYDLYVKVM